MKKFLLIIACLLMQVNLWGQSPSLTREALADSIALKIGSYVSTGAEEFVDSEFSLLRTPANVWNYFKGKEKRRAIIETRLSKHINPDSITSLVNSEIARYNRSPRADYIKPITLSKLEGVISTEAAEAVQDRAALEVLDLTTDFFVFPAIGWLVALLVTYFFLAPWLAAKIEGIDMSEALFEYIIEKKTGGSGVLDFVGKFVNTLAHEHQRQQALEAAIAKKKAIRRWVGLALTALFLVWSIIQAPKKEAKAQQAITQSYIEVLSGQNIIDHILNE